MFLLTLWYNDANSISGASFFMEVSIFKLKNGKKGQSDVIWMSEYEFYILEYQ